MLAWLFSPIGRALSAVLAVLSVLGGVFLAGRRKGSQAASERFQKADEKKADQISQKANEVDRDEIRNLGDDDLDRRLRKLRGRQGVDRDL